MMDRLYTRRKEVTTLSTKSTDLIEVYIPLIGKCTLFPSIDDLRDDLNTYQTMLEVARLLNLHEIPKRSHNETQAIWKVLAPAFEGSNQEAIRILISGVHDSYPSINTSQENQKPVQCITALDMVLYSAKKLFGVSNPFTRHAEMTLDEVPVDEQQEVDKLFYCLFLSAPK